MEANSEQYLEDYLDEARQRAMTVLNRPFPQTAIKERRGGGGKMLDYLEGHTVIHRLNEATGGNWDFVVVDISWDERLELYRAHVRLTIPGLGTREHIGVQAVKENAGEDLIKGAITDALKKAATLFGVGLHLYGNNWEHEQAFNAIKNYIAKQPVMKSAMAEWIRSELDNEAIKDQSVDTLRELLRDLQAQFPMHNDTDAVKLDRPLPTLEEVKAKQNEQPPM